MTCPEYTEMVQWLFQRSRGLGMRLGLERMERAGRKLLGPSQGGFPTIHVAGTNGKGSVATKIANGLFLNGLKVGLYTSPHIQSVCERICVNMAPIPPERLVEVYQKVRMYAIEEELTFFEIMTLIGFLIFSEERVDVAVVEVGLGGRLDATNIITPLLSVITSIGVDHTEQLGKTIEEIAIEKAGIIKKGVSVVVGPTATLPAVESICSQKEAPCHKVPLRRGVYDEENSDIALRALQLLRSRFSLSESVCEEAVHIRPRCRFERVPTQYVREASGCAETPPVYLDVAHNPDGMRRLVEWVSSRFVVVFACCRTKDVSGMLQILEKKVDFFVFPDNLESQKLCSARELFTCARRLGIGEEKMSVSETIEDALSSVALPRALQRNVPVVITGSFFFMGQVRRFFGYEELCDPLGLDLAVL